MSYQISKELPEQFTDKFFIYNGTESIEEMNENLEALQLQRSKCYYIQLGGQFYAVFFESFEREIVVGRDKVYYIENGRLTEYTIADAKIGFTIKSRNVRFITDTLARELHTLYNPIEFYEYPTSKSKNYRKVERVGIEFSNYLVLLGVTFSSRFYTSEEADKMEKYFKHTPNLLRFLNKTRGAVAIDPFSQYIKFENGDIGTYSYKTRKNEYGGSTAVFALQQKNLYSPLRKREWMSLTRYMAIFPEDKMDYKKPDFREDKTTCKWCGGHLPERKRDYCSAGCRLEFSRAVDLERAAIIPYLIMCRDQFVCQTCGKDMAKINKHGMKIPIPYLQKVPDKDGKCRSEAEVDHIIAIEDGGTEHQSNLATICYDCHKKKHGRVNRKAEGWEQEVQPSNVVPFKRVKEQDSTGPTANVKLATDKQIKYLLFLAKKNGAGLRNLDELNVYEASKLIAFFAKRTPVAKETLMKYVTI